MSNVVNLAEARRKPPPVAPPKLPHPADALSFMKFRKPKGSGIDYWIVAPTGDYSADYAKGSELGREFLAYIGQHPTNGNTTILTPIVSDMMKRVAPCGRLSGIEIGFLNCVNEVAMVAANAIREATS